MSALKSWRQVRFDLYSRLRAQCHRLLGQEDAEIKRYQRHYDQDISRPWEVATLSDLLAQIKRTKIVLMGDFHALQQSQKGHLRILRILPKKRPKILFVECIRSQDQGFLNQFIAGELSEADFLKKIKWEENWGYSWRSYKPIILWAKRHQVPVIAIDKAIEVHGDQSLQTRDQFAAQAIHEILNQADPQTLGLVIIGDYHIATENLPKELAHWTIYQEQTLRIFQNSESIYMDLLDSGQEFEVDVVRFSALDFSLVSVAPWVKWHSLLMHLETQIEGDTELNHQLQDEVIRFLNLIQSDLKYAVPEDGFEVFNLSDAAFWTRVTKVFKKKELDLIRGFIQAGMSFYLPQIRAVFIAKISLNHAAEGAMAVWHATLTQETGTSFFDEDKFYRLVWSQCVNYFGSKLVNPKRKTDTLYDVKLRLRHLGDSELYLKQVVYLKSQEWMSLSGLDVKIEKIKLPPIKIRAQVAQILGAMAGEKLYYLYRKRKISNPELMQLLLAPPKSWETTYFDLIKLMEKYQDPFISKRWKV